MSDEKIRYRLPHTVVEVERKTRIRSGHKDTNGVTVLVEEDLGWFVTLAPGHMCCPVGPERPNLKPGDRLDVLLEPAG